MTRTLVALACALLGVAEAALAQESPPPVQQVQMTCRMAKNVPSGTKVHVSMRAKYTHFQDAKVNSRRYGAGGRNRSRPSLVAPASAGSAWGARG